MAFVANFEEVELLGALQPIPESIKMDLGPERKLNILSRQLFQDVRSSVQEICDLPESAVRNDKKVLTGPAGVGKSLLLYLCANDCIKSKKWFVVYIGMTSKFHDMPDELVARNILTIIHRANEQLAGSSTKLDEILALIKEGKQDSSKACENLREVFLRIYDCGVPVFIGIDQWNCLQPSGGITQPLLKSLFDKYNKFELVWGYSLLAVSSSFDLHKSGMFTDYEAALAERRLELLAEQEWLAIVGNYRQRGLIPPETSLSNDSLHKLTGFVPRLLVSVKLEYEELKVKGYKEWKDINTFNVSNINRKYFEAKVETVTSRHRETEDIEFAALVVINKYDNLMSYSSPWIDSGLFALGPDGLPRPIAADVLTAMYNVVKTQSDQIIFLLANSYAKWVAFELFVKLGFLQNNVMDFLVRRLDGTEENASTLTINVSQHFLQERDQPLPNKESLKNTMIVCYKGHPVADLVIYSGGKLFLISIFLEAYTKHGTSAADVFKIKVGNSGKSVLEYYCETSPYPDLVKLGTSDKWTEALKNNVKFVFVTIDNTIHNKNSMKKSGAKSVYRINGELLQKFGNSYNLFLPQ
ncbi:hypothetical protein MP638_003751 [Amoeboaphelidium occidentale]|nr:hypothetical protein MP638_003751 [Amoeboaphelidium occidentale]